MQQRHPRAFWFLSFGELAERSSFYGMKAILMLYLIDQMGFTRAEAGPINHRFTAACYLLSIVGAYVADRWLGRYKTIIYFALPYIAGHLILGATASRTWLFIALGLLAMGSGVIKPNVSPMLGALYDDSTEEGRRLRSQAFGWFYAGINLGAGASMAIVPLVRNKWGYSVAFVCPTVLMAVSLVIFALGKRHYPTELPKSEQPIISKAQHAADRQTLLRLTGVFSLLVFFWAIYDQASSTWTLFAKDYCELHGIAPDMIQGLNPFLIVLLTPIFNRIWVALEKRRGQPVYFTRKMLLGFGLVIICMLVMAVAGYASAHGKISIAWEVAAYIVITLAELCISVAGLEAAFAESPKHLKSSATAILLLTVFAGNLLAGELSEVYTRMQPGNYFGLLAALMTAVAIVFLFVSRWFEQSRPTQTEVVL